MQLSDSDLRELSRQAMRKSPKTGRLRGFGKGWLRYTLLGLLLAGSAVALRGGLWSQSPANAAKRAAARSARAKTKILPKVKMLLEHNERDINLRIKKGNHTLPRPTITRSDRMVTVELPGVQVRPRKWTLSGSRVSSINVKVDKRGSKLVIAQDPTVKGKLKDAFSAEDDNGNLVLRVLNESIGDRTGQSRNAPTQPVKLKAKVAAASTAVTTTKKVLHPLGQRLTKKDHTPHSVVEPDPPTEHAPEPVKGHKATQNHAKVQPSPVHLAAQSAPRTPIAVVEHPVDAVAAHPEKPHTKPSPEHKSGDRMMKTTLSMAGSVLAFGLLVLVPILWWKKKQQGPTSHIKVLERLPLSVKHSLVRVQLGGEELWLGLSDGNIQVISPQSKSSPKLAAVKTFKTQQPVQAPGSSAQADLFIAPDPIEAPQVLNSPDLAAPAPVAAPPPTMARRKLQAFKLRLKEALAHGDEQMPAANSLQDAGRQADAIRRELARRNAEASPDSTSGMQRDVA